MTEKSEVNLQYNFNESKVVLGHTWSESKERKTEDIGVQMNWIVKFDQIKNANAWKKNLTLQMKGSLRRFKN